MRIKFLANSPIAPGTVEAGAKTPININMAYFMMKHYHDLHGRSRPEWLPQEFITVDSADDQVNRLLTDQVDVLLLPCFVWNYELQKEIARLFRQHRPEARIIMGGPHLTAHRRTDFFEECPWVDYAVYGDGERALSLLLDHFSGQDNQDQWVNIVENRQGRAHCYPYEMLRDSEYWSSSPYLDQQDFIRENLTALYALGYRASQVMIAIEFARGCMYSCAFCDWSQNLTKKVVRRQSRWREELDFFCELDVAIRETDANFGAWDQDIEIYDYARSLYRPDRNFKFLVWNTAKLKKNAYHFLIHNAEQYQQRVVLSLQDTNERVLKLMQRPSLSWDQHVELINQMKHRLGSEKFSSLVYAQLMLGTPGQSIETFKENFERLFNIGIYNIELGQWVLLPNSPGADINYQKMHGVEWLDHQVYAHTSPFNESCTSLNHAYTISEHSLQFTKTKMVFQTNTLAAHELIAVLLANEVFKISFKSFPKADHKTYIDRVFGWCLARSQIYLEQHQTQINQHNFITPGVYDGKNFYTGWHPIKILSHN